MHAEFVLRTQLGVRFRAGGPGDSAQLREFICGLSPRSQYLRFFACVAPPSSGLLRALCGCGGADVVLALHGGQVIGHCMAADRDGSPPGLDGSAPGRTSDIGLVVADEWQQRGIGTTLLRLAVARAAGRGTRMLIMDVQPGNHRILGVLGRRWPDASRELTADSIVIRVCLTAADLTQADLAAADLAVDGVPDDKMRNAPRTREAAR